jgi:hypothetical protein
MGDPAQPTQPATDPMQDPANPAPTTNQPQAGDPNAPVPPLPQTDEPVTRDQPTTNQ